MLVIDASVAAKLVLTEEGTDTALELLDGPQRLTAPALIRYEVAGAVIKRFRLGEMEEAVARAACGRWDAILRQPRLQLMPVESLYADAIDLAFQVRHPIVDCIYLAAAKHLHAELITADVKFHERASKVYPRVDLLARAA